MANPDLPPRVSELLADRASARQARDWSRADALRDEIAGLGWEVQDSPAGPSARPMLAPSPAPSPERIEGPPVVDVCVQLTAEDHPADFARCVGGLAAHPPRRRWELVVVANGPSFVVEEALASARLDVDPIVIHSAERLGWADARTLGLRQSGGEVTILLDTSLEPTGDFVAPLVAAFDDDRVGIAGGWGVTSGDGRQFHDAPPGEVDAVEGYCLAIRREALRSVGGFDRRFRFYRNADLDLSFAVRDAGWRAVRTEPLPLERHEHRGWTSLPEAERDRLSKRNFYRFLDHWGDRRDLLLHAADPDS
jgi:GT2 family glycosyltransferase